MAILTRDRLQALLQSKSGPCISLYMTTHRQHPGTEQDPIRFKNGLKEAERLLSDRHPPEEIRELLDPVASLPSAEFWRHQADGLAVLRSRDVLEEFRLPLRVPELVVVADSFHVRPLIRCLSSNERYFLVALSQNEVTVFQGSMESLTRTPVPGLPASMADHMGTRRNARTLSAHATRRGPGERRLHAAGGTVTATEQDLRSYFRAIDRALQHALRHDGALVILAGVEHYLPIYREITRLKNVADQIVAGSPDSMTVSELGKRAWSVTQGCQRANQDLALAKYRQAAERGKSSEDLEEIVRRARRRGVRRLFLAPGVRVWGTIDPTSGRLHRTPEQQGSHDDDLLDDVAEAVLLSGGDVITVPFEQMPNGREVAAELR